MVYHHPLPADVREAFEGLLSQAFPVCEHQQHSYVLDGVTNFGVYDGSMLIAVACVRERRLTFSKVSNVAVHKDYRRLGVCSFLLHNLMTIYPRLSLWVETDNMAAIDCYQKVGFKLLPGYGNIRTMTYGSRCSFL